MYYATDIHPKVSIRSQKNREGRKDPSRKGFRTLEVLGICHDSYLEIGFHLETSTVRQKPSACIYLASETCGHDRYIEHAFHSFLCPCPPPSYKPPVLKRRKGSQSIESGWMPWSMHLLALGTLAQSVGFSINLGPSTSSKHYRYHEVDKCI